MKSLTIGDRVVISLSNISFHLPGTILRQSELQFDSDLRFVIELDTGKYISLPSSRVELYDNKSEVFSKEYFQMINKNNK